MCPNPVTRFVLYLSFLFLAIQYGSAVPTKKIKTLENQVIELKEQVKKLSDSVMSLEKMMVFNMGDQYSDKTIQHIQSNNQNEATKFWMELLNPAKQSNRTEELLSQVVMKSYSGTRSNFYPLLEFILRNNVPAAFPLLYKELESYGHIFGGQEIFVLAQYLKETCGISTKLYQNLPQVVRQIVSIPVILKNNDNMGYIIASPQDPPCHDTQSCYTLPKSEVFIHKLTRSAESELQQNSRSHWQFVPPLTYMDMKDGFNGTRMSWGFNIRNLAVEKFLIVRTRLVSYFLRDNTTFDSYNAGDLQCQFMPMLIQNYDGKIIVGIKEKYLNHKTEYIYGSKFVRRDVKINLEKRNGYTIDGKIWQVFPVESNEDHSMEANRIEDDIMSNSKCQF